MLDQERKGEQELEAYTSPPVAATGGIEISPNGKEVRIVGSADISATNKKDVILV